MGEITGRVYNLSTQFKYGDANSDQFQEITSQMTAMENHWVLHNCNCALWAWVVPKLYSSAIGNNQSNNYISGNLFITAGRCFTLLINAHSPTPKALTNDIHFYCSQTQRSNIGIMGRWSGMKINNWDYDDVVNLVPMDQFHWCWQKS